MAFLTVILIVVLLIHVGLGIYAIIQVVKTCEFTTKQKRINILLIIFVPIIWSVLIYYMLKKLPESYEIDPKDKFISNDFYESKKGFYGGGGGAH
jgi:hypothetical protein